MFKVLHYSEAAEIMKNVTKAIDHGVFDLGGKGLLSIVANDYNVEYELVDGEQMEQWYLDNTPCCGKREHIGWACDKESCMPF